MMQRLRDQVNSPDATTARAAELLAAVRPLDPNQVRGWAHPWNLARMSRRRAPVGRLRLAVTGALTFASLAAAAATAHRAGWFGHAPVPVSPPDGPVAVAGPIAHAVVARPPGAPSAAEAVAPSEPNGGDVVAPAPRRLPPEAQPRETVAAGTSAESVLMVQAVRALRRDGDPARAQALAEEALRRYPKGAQVEEAMVLAMEAASARGDRSGAHRAAVRYLERYPAGRFADRAQRVVSGSRDGD
jgi:hypothetical protein